MLRKKEIVSIVHSGWPLGVGDLREARGSGPCLRIPEAKPKKRGRVVNMRQTKFKRSGPH
jgi:hypothetical protein